MIKTYKCITALILIIVVASCQKETKASNFTLKGSIKDLKKGIVYLQKDGDSSNIIDLDSMVIKGQPEFTLSADIDEPLLLYVKLFQNDGEEHYIPFFADKGVMELNTSLANFNSDAKITGSKQQELLEDYLKLMSDFNNRNLDLIKANFLAQKSENSKVSDSLIAQSNRLLKLKYAATINFALNHKDSEIAPYLALYEIPNTTIRYLDTIYNNLTDPIKKSYYGKILEGAIVRYKAN
ncbi:DUF4369 domain-containing protein [Winogradskyella immobilis]|uniref:DUF4369 domain-containing protein n=1 Tax=Winogradskyella immobilis TaxID=2816852 RepID=A0ABS8ENA4_9FLAO|nr:DUF4369 domain-containing protein [Winogradskyella immobilis]MCC1484506.1 DUF4369 domain-containing protein [Winogradskyella immobilis]MCG0016598.1 DUF4369 domain-containing protein [Winogradskyella immobilis]